VHPCGVHDRSEDVSYSGAFYYAASTISTRRRIPPWKGLGRSLLSTTSDYMVEVVGIDGGTLSLLDLRRFPRSATRWPKPSRPRWTA